MRSKVRSETPVSYQSQNTDDQVVAQAISILKKRLRVPGEAMTNPDTVKKFLALHTAELEHECFSVIWLDTRHRLIKYEVLFRGTIDGASVYPREVAKAALACNAAAVIFAHNHPSGNPEPSADDRRITERLKDALSLMDVRVLDHVIVGGADYAVSFAERGMI